MNKKELEKIEPYYKNISLARMIAKDLGSSELDLKETEFATERNQLIRSGLVTEEDLYKYPNKSAAEFIQILEL